jgi:23S rRNA (adenine2503-C2)-methyltransferase
VPALASSEARANLLGLERQGWEDFFRQRGEKTYRGRQVFERLHRNGGRGETGDSLNDLPKPLRDEVLRTGVLDELPLAECVPARDGVQKLLFDVGAHNRIEAVIIPEARRTTLCISSQVGCALACRFCLTGEQGFSRNLTTAEILTQLRTANRLLATQNEGRTVGNVVMMGMGEPLLNTEAVFPALRIMTDQRGYGLAHRRVTVSTAGVVPALKRLREACTVSLAVSLHAPVDSLRDELMPINRKYPLAKLMQACHDYLLDRPRALVTFEYVMLSGVNDGPGEARALIRLLHGIRSKVNLIPFNPFAGTAYQTSSPETIRAFRDRIIKGGIMATIRKTRGDDILAACGQLAGSVRARTYGLREKPMIPHRSPA